MEKKKNKMGEKDSGFSIELDENHLNEIEDIFNSNIEVFVTLQDGFTLTIIVGTPKNLQYLMEKDKVNFYGLVFLGLLFKN
jgi:uncharacterized protein YneR